MKSPASKSRISPGTSSFALTELVIPSRITRAVGADMLFSASMRLFRPPFLHRAQRRVEYHDQEDQDRLEVPVPLIDRQPPEKPRTPRSGSGSSHPEIAGKSETMNVLGGLPVSAFSPVPGKAVLRLTPDSPRCAFGLALHKRLRNTRWRAVRPAFAPSKTSLSRFIAIQE